MNVGTKMEPRLGLLLRHCGLVFLGGVLLCTACQTEAKEISASTPSITDVEAAVAQAANGDVVTVPAGVAYWDRMLSINNKGITLSGAGTNDTILVDALTNRSFAMFRITFTNPVGMFRMSSLQLKAGTNAAPLATGFIWITGSDLPSGNSKWRLDHLYFNKTDTHSLYVAAWSGLIDHCWIDVNGAGGAVTFETWFNTGNGDFGDRSWARPVQWGTVDAGVYVEDCYFTNTAMRGATDAYGGARFVFRNNVCNNCTVQTHGTESGGRIRGARSIEVYGNTFYSPVFSGGAVFFRSGTGLVFSNSLSGLWPGVLVMDNYRNLLSVNPWGQANGTSVWDLNFTTLFDSGTHTGTNGATTLADSTKSWTANQWMGHHLINTTTGKAGEILSSTATTITCTPPIFQNDQIIFTSGDSYEIRKIDRALDQPGVGQGDLLSGNPPTPVGWPHQADEPIYYWANSGVTNAIANRYNIIAGRNYTNVAKPGYVPFKYPHPLTSVPLPPTGLKMVSAQ